MLLIRKLPHLPEIFVPFLALIMAIAPRVLAFSVYEPIRSLDTPTYEQLAHQIVSFDFSNYNGTRVPIYPIFLLINNFDAYHIWFFQSALGILTSILVFIVAFSLSQRFLVAFLASAICSLSLNQVFHEAQLLTEAMTSFLLMGVVFFLNLYIKDRKVWLVIALGFLAAMLVLTHPIFILVGPLLSVFILILRDHKKRWTHAVILFVVFAIPVAGWIMFNKVKLDFLGITTFMGFNLSNHAGGFIEKAPKSEIRDIYLKYREKKIAERGDHSMTIFEAAPEIYQKTGLTLPQLSKELSRISISLFTSYPHLYLVSVMKSWLSFWAVPNYWVTDKISPIVFKTILTKTWSVEQIILRVINLIFVLSVFLLFMVFLKERGNFPNNQIVILIISTLVLCVSFVIAFFEYGETRYSLTTQPLIILVVCLNISLGRNYLAERLSSRIIR